MKILTLLVLIIHFRLGILLKCYSMPFPQIMGGSLGTSELYSLDYDSKMNIVTAGATYDKALHQMSEPIGYYPFIMMIDGAFKMKRWIKVYDNHNFYIKKVVFNSDATRVAIAMRYFFISGEIMETLVYTLNAFDGSSRTHYSIPYNGFDEAAFDLKE